MNELAHFQLAAAKDGWLVGALLGDYVKGPLRENEWPDTWLEGIRLHRRIDALTDNHPLLTPIRDDLPPELRRYAGILVDVTLDHWLARHWDRIHPDPLRHFTQHVYRVLEAARPDMPPAAARRAGALIRHQPLGHYRDWSMVCAALARISQRLTRDNPLDQAARIIKPLQSSWGQRFEAFYPVLAAELHQR